MSISKIKEHGIAMLIKTYNHRFMYGGKINNYLSDVAQNLLKECTALDKRNILKEFILSLKIH